MFETPARIDELGREPVEQLVVPGTRRLAPEIEDRFDERLTEMTHPDMIHRDPSSERIFAGGDPLREHEPTSRAYGGKGRGVAVVLVFGSLERFFCGPQ